MNSEVGEGGPWTTHYVLLSPISGGRNRGTERMSDLPEVMQRLGLAHITEPRFEPWTESPMPQLLVAPVGLCFLLLVFIQSTNWGTSYVMMESLHLILKVVECY